MRLRRNMIAVATAFTLALAGCSAATGTTATSTTSSSSATSSTSANTGSTATTATVVNASIEDDTHYDADDLVWDTSDEVSVTLADDASTVEDGATGVTVDGNTITITAAGDYNLSGTLSDGQIVVAAGDDDIVRIILNGVSLTSSSGSPFVVSNANEAIVYLADGSTNTITDAASYADTADDAPNAALYSMSDLTIAGSGALTVTGNYDDGITSKDGLVLVSGNVTVNAVDDGIIGKDYVAVLDGTYTVTAADDGVKSDNDEDEGRGWLLVSGGALTVTAGDDGVKAYNTLTVTGGSVTVANSNEGLEAVHIVISGGDVDITSADDGINAAGGTAAETTGGGGGSESDGGQTLDISGGAVTVNAEGDGLDSNGSASISGGTVVVNGPTANDNGALDVNGDLLVTGGTIAAAGSSGMAVTPSADSTQSGLQVTFDSAIDAGTVVSLVDSDGNIVATFVTTKQASSLIFSAANIVAGATYTVQTGGSADVTAGLGTGTLDGASVVATVTAGEYTAGGMGGGGMGGGRMGGGGTPPTR